MIRDIIPDIHGQADKLTGLLSKLGYRESRGTWRHPDPGRSVVFLGDFIDRGPENARVLHIVRSMIDAGEAQAIMGNHELNAIHFHTRHSSTGLPLRAHSEKNLKQHARFLDDHPVGSDAARDAIAWMKTLPLWLEFPEFRAIHACWDRRAMAEAERYLNDARLDDQAVEWSADPDHPLYRAVEVLAKGPEALLPDGTTFTDKDGHARPEIRMAWWKMDARTWQDIAICVPDPERQLPAGALTADIGFEPYPADAKPVFFGHYWLSGEIVLQAPNALCLDYSAGKEGPLIAYTFENGAKGLDLGNVTVG
jgi:hypothetical protein